MKVLLLTQRFPPAIGGVENHVWNLAMRLHEGGDHVTVLTTDLRKDLPLERLAPGENGLPFSVRRFHAIRLAQMPHGLGIVAPAMIPEALTLDADVVHAHAYGYFPTFVGSLVQAFNGVPLVITTHSDPGRTSFAKAAFDWVVPALTLRRAQQIIALTEGESHHLQKLGVAGDRISVIPNGVNPGEFSPRSESPKPGTTCTVLFVGRCYPEQKGLQHLIRAMALLPPSLGVRLRIVGEDWGGTEGLRLLAESLGVANLVSFDGPLSRAGVVEAFRRSDMFALPSLFEPFGIAVLEAMSAGLPVVASRVGGVPEVVEEGSTALLVPPGDQRQLADALERLARDPALRAALGAAGRRRSLQFSWDRIAPQIRQVYREASRRRPSSPAGLP